MPHKLSAWALALTFLGISLPQGGAERDAPAEAADVYTCPMHPEVTDTKPSRCPKCKMKLVPK